MSDEIKMRCYVCGTIATTTTNPEDTSAWMWCAACVAQGAHKCTACGLNRDLQGQEKCLQCMEAEDTELAVDKVFCVGCKYWVYVLWDEEKELCDLCDDERTKEQRAAERQQQKKKKRAAKASESAPAAATVAAAAAEEKKLQDEAKHTATTSGHSKRKAIDDASTSVSQEHEETNKKKKARVKHTQVMCGFCDKPCSSKDSIKDSDFPGEYFCSEECADEREHIGKRSKAAHKIKG